MIISKIAKLIAIVSILILSSCDSDSDSDSDDNNSGECSASETNATYLLTFSSTWSQETHPTSFPSNPHFSPIVGGVHNSIFDLWKEGGKATSGIQIMAETGGTQQLVNEVAVAVAENNALGSFVGGGIAASPGSTEATVTLSKNFHIVSAVSMIAPSPDWFIGIKGVSLCDSTGWLESVRVELKPYDAGTDSGISYDSENSPTSPQGVISEITTVPFDKNSILGNITLTLSSKN